MNQFEFVKTVGMDQAAVQKAVETASNAFLSFGDKTLDERAAHAQAGARAVMEAYAASCAAVSQPPLS